MKRLAQKPTRQVLEGPGYTDGMIEKNHPAFAVASFHRVNGGDPKLFASDITHGQRICLTISRAKEQWQLSQRWHHGDSKALIEVEMSESQFVSLVSTFNVGGGTPVTLIKTETDWEIPAIDDDEDSLIEMIKADIQQDVKTVVAQAAKIVTELRETLASSGIPKKRQEGLLALAEKLHQNLTANMPFVLKQYQEGVDDMQAQAKAEIDAFAVHAAARLGVKSLQQLAAAINSEFTLPPPATHPAGLTDSP